MNKLLTIIALLLASQSFAHELPTCEEKPKVVKKKRKKAAAKPQPEKCHNTVIVREIPYVVNTPVLVPRPMKRNRLSLKAGFGPGAIKQTVTGPVTEYSITNRFVYGIAYDRLITREWTIGIQGLSNNTAVLSVGKDF